MDHRSGSSWQRKREQYFWIGTNALLLLWWANRRDVIPDDISTLFILATAIFVVLVDFVVSTECARARRVRVARWARWWTSMSATLENHEDPGVWTGIREELRARVPKVSAKHSSVSFKLMVHAAPPSTFRLAPFRLVARWQGTSIISLATLMASRSTALEPLAPAAHLSASVQLRR